LFFIFSILFIKPNLKKVSDFASIILVISLITPATVLYGYDIQREFVPLCLLLIPLLVIYAVCDLRLVKPIKMPKFNNSYQVVQILSWLMMAYLTVWYFATGAAFNANLNFTKVYEFRDANSELTDSGIFAYLNVWTYKIFGAFLFCMALHKKNYILSIFIFLFYIFFFAVNNHKAVVFFPLLLFSVYFYFSKSSSSLVIPLGFITVVMSGLGLFLLFDMQYVASMAIRRLFFVPAALTFEYVSFTHEFGYVFWRDSVLSVLGGYQHDLPLSFAVGNYILNPELGANNGFVSTGYAHGGVLAVIFYSLIYGYMLRLLDHVSSYGFPLWVSLALTVIPIRTALLSSDLFTVLLTHGLFLSVLLLLMLPKSIR
jgi:hypothetical protein